MNQGVLIVDDSLTVRMDLGEAFESVGFTTRLCETVSAARDSLAGDTFHVIVLDVLLPDADGIEFLKELKANPETARIPVILLSSEVEVRDRIRGLKTGADEYVGKPYDAAYVVARARELVRRDEPLPASESMTVLVIDDSPTYREEMKSALESRGYSVLTAGTGEDGLRIAVDSRPGAIIVDGFMPGIDGATVVRRIRQDAVLRRTPCILLTASEERTDEVRALDAGADGYVRKDDDIAVILARLAAVLRSAAPPLATSPTSSLLGPKKILAVDDSETYLQSLGEQLRCEGYDVALARSGEEALDLLAVQQADCILLDLIMPGLSGHDTCRRIKSSPLLRDIPLMMLTAREEREAMIEGINAGADDYIAKSSDFEVLRARLRAQLRRKQFEDENRHIREELVHKEVEAAEARAARALAEARAVLLADLEDKNAQLARANTELESFSYSVSHDLRAPLRAIDGFSHALLDGWSDKLDDQGKKYLAYVRESAQQMAQLIDDLLEMSRVTLGDIRRNRVDLTALARHVVHELQLAEPGRQVELIIDDEMFADGDTRLLGLVLQNLLGNAWKFTAKCKHAAKIEFGQRMENGQVVYRISDNGAGFDMKYAAKLFGVFQRLHSSTDFEGSGIGLATVHRIVQRHGGRVWAEGQVDRGATFHFTLRRSAPKEVTDGPIDQLSV